MAYSNDEDKKNLSRVMNNLEKMNSKAKSYKKAAEAATEQAQHALSRYRFENKWFQIMSVYQIHFIQREKPSIINNSRKLQNELNEATERAEMAEAAVTKARARAKAQ